MPASRTILIMLLLAVLLPGCVEPYTPEIKGSKELLVVEGLLTDQPGDQYIYVTRSSSFNNPIQIPQAECLVWVIDDRGNSYEFTEEEAGVYKCWMAESQLKMGIAYQLIIQTAEEKQYESDLEFLTDTCPPIDSVYYETEYRETSDPYAPLRGLQFYIDLDAHEYKANNYYWELIETWEYHSVHDIQYYYFDSTLFAMPDPALYYNCWQTKSVGSIHTASTKHLFSNTLSRHPLHFVSDNTNRLKFKYSLLVRQYSLNDVAFEYLDQMRSQGQESGGLYEKQPSQLSGNIRNINDPDEVVLGFFNVSSTSEKRIFVSNVRGLRFSTPYCKLDTIDSIEVFPSVVNKPIYLISVAEMQMGPPYAYGTGICFDCTTYGGTIIRPDYWE